MLTQICCECGKSVAPSSGKFVNRVLVLDVYYRRLVNGRPFPEGDYVCAECDAKTSDD